MRFRIQPAMALLALTALTPSTRAPAEPTVRAIGAISALPEVFQENSKTTEEIHQKFEKRMNEVRNSLGSAIWTRYEKTKISSGGGLNPTPEYRQAAMLKAIKSKIIPGFHDIYEVSQKLGIEPKAILMGMLTENTLATNNTATKWGLEIETWKGLDHMVSSHKSLEEYAAKMDACDRGQIRGKGTKGPKDFLEAIGLSKDAECTECRKRFDKDASSLFLCYWEFLGEVKVPGGTLSDGKTKASSYGPAQLHLENALSVIDVPGFYGVNGAIGHERPTNTHVLLEDVDDQIFSLRGAIAIVGAMMKLAQIKYLEKGWDLSQDYPVLVTMYHIGNVAYWAGQAKPPGGKYYPTSDFFGTYSVLIESFVDDIVRMGIDIEQKKQSGWDLDRIRNLIAKKVP